jgi:hypothetical protein
MTPTPQAVPVLRTGYAQATDPFEVARLIHHAVTTDSPQLRYAVSWAGPELIAGRQSISDEEWIALGAHEDDADYYAAFQSAFGLDISSS